MKPAPIAAPARLLPRFLLATDVRIVLKMALPTEPPAERKVPRRPALTPSSSTGTKRPEETYARVVTQLFDC